jgi:Zn-finger nucleic acid-binding protein
MKYAELSCPLCNVPLLGERRQNVEIDQCPQCRGVWLDRNELDKIMDRERPLPTTPDDSAIATKGAPDPHAA